MAINKVSQDTKEAIARKSAQYLPNNPSARGMTADQIRKAFYAPVTDTAASVLAEIDRVVDESNEAIENEERQRTEAIKAEETARNEAIENEKTERTEAINTLTENMTSLGENLSEKDSELAEEISKKVDKVQAQQGKQYTVAVVDKDGNPTSLAIDVGGYGFAIPLRETGGRLRVPEPTTDAHAINRGYLNKRVETEIDPKLAALETALSGKARSYVLEDWEDLKELLWGRWEIGNGVPYYTDELLTGDNILIVQKDVPDFWFEKTTDTTRTPDEYTYTYVDENGVEQSETVRLFVHGYDNGGEMVGLLHILESDYTVIEGYSKAASRAAEEAKGYAETVRESIGDVGNIGEALDEIHAYAQTLIGGGS